MFWKNVNLPEFETPIREEFSAIFGSYSSIASAVQNRPFGLAVASHLANRIRLHSTGRHFLDPDQLEVEFERSLRALSAFGVVARDSCYAPGLDGFESEPFLLTSESSVDDRTVADIERAKMLIGETEYAYVCERLRSVAIITLERQCFPETNQSYTIQAVLQTVYIDVYEHPILTAESLVHEHAHMTFNNYVRSKRLKFDPEPRFYSPWKERERPIFNFLHSLIAFSEVIQFIQEISTMDLDRLGRSYVDMKLRFELGNIKSVRDAAVSALMETPDREVATLIKRALDRLGAL